MLVRLESVFKVLGDEHLTLKLKKCHFACEQVDFLGYTLTTDGLQPGSIKMDAILHFPIPKNCHEVRRFLGLTGYFRNLCHTMRVNQDRLVTYLKRIVNLPGDQNRPQHSN